MQGTVKWFNDAKGFGFIAADGKDYFVHYKEIQIPGFKTLTQGLRVSFNPQSSPKGPLAKEVKVEE